MSPSNHVRGRGSYGLDLITSLNTLAAKWLDEGASIEDVNIIANELLDFAESRGTWLDCGQAKNDALNMIVQAIGSYARESPIDTQ